MVNRADNLGLFGFPLFGGPQRPVQTLNVNVQDTEKALVIEGIVEGFEKEHIKIEYVRNGLLLTAEKTIEKEVANAEDEENQLQTPPQVARVQRFVPVFFPFTDEDVSASFENNTLKVVINKNDAHRKYISID
ncbi:MULTISPECIES: Hsp20/alpha crystallin family protein [Bacillaceae]|uniref:Hsp20/alpha crystallin family protein n=1 Tax=Evansella alkalicola TaxID=745819 RepID=A0ABS6JTZ3_9BACI|nr:MULTISPECIES: Hsp20/alpha crystallin family protein [Bacillaceae]MBU9721885.1 Hsp20/alpha crystallin family protein [Bacillus alkalicola]